MHNKNQSLYVSRLSNAQPATQLLKTKVAHMGMALGETDVVISHGKANFMKQEKLAKVLREGQTRAFTPKKHHWFHKSLC